MSAGTVPSTATGIHLPSYLAGNAVFSDDRLDVLYPWDDSLTGTVSQFSAVHLNQAIETALAGGEPLTRYQRHEVLNKARQLLADRAEEFANLIRSETGLCMRETTYEVGRSQDVLQFAAAEALRDDGEVFSCDVSPQGKARKIITVREPASVVAAITPFNHPLNQVVHKIAPAVAAGTAMLLKPSDKTPLTAIRFAELLYEAGLPGWMLSVFVGSIQEVVEPLVRDERISALTFTGGTEIGKRVASMAGYKKVCLELGGNSPLIILDDADIDVAVTLAAEGCFRNSGQRCTAVKRLLVHESILNAFTKKFVEVTKQYVSGDPAAPKTRVGTVINEASAMLLQQRVKSATQQGAKVLVGGERRGALLEPTVIADVPRNAEMVRKESFGPLAPIMRISDIDDAIKLANDSSFGLSSGIVTNNMQHALQAVKQIRTGTVNVNQVPGYRIECSPFGGLKDSGLGVKEGVIEAIKFMTTVKTFSLPW
jgi:phosphonoacetaldehyde dehydrogenase